jgi:hypothetical protein
MAIFDATAFGAVLKDVYGPEIVTQVNDKMTALEMFNMEKFAYEGNAVKYPLLFGRGQSFLAHGPLGSLPTPQNETDALVTITRKWIRGLISVSYDAMALSRTNRGSWARAQEQLMSRLVINLADERNRMLSSGSGTGTLALIDGAAAGTTTLTLDAPGGYALDGWGSRYIQPGMIIAINDGTSLIYAVRQVATIATETVSSASITVNSAVAAGEGPNNAFVHRIATASSVDLVADSSLNNEPMGLEGLNDDGTNVATFQNVLRSTYPDWKSTLISASVLSLSVMQRLWDSIDQHCGEPVTDLFSHHSVRRQYLALIDTSRTFMQAGSGPGNYDLGLDKMMITYNGTRWTVDRDARFGTLHMLNRGHLIYYPLVEGEWADETGAVFTRVNSNQDAYEALYRWAGNYGTDRPASHGKITGLSDTDAIERHVV